MKSYTLIILIIFNIYSDKIDTTKFGKMWNKISYIFNNKTDIKIQFNELEENKKLINNKIKGFIEDKIIWDNKIKIQDDLLNKFNKLTEDLLINNEDGLLMKINIINSFIKSFKIKIQNIEDENKLLYEKIKYSEKYPNKKEIIEIINIRLKYNKANINLLRLSINDYNKEISKINESIKCSKNDIKCDEIIKIFIIFLTENDYNYNIIINLKEIYINEKSKIDIKIIKENIKINDINKNYLILKNQYKINNDAILKVKNYIDDQEISIVNQNYNKKVLIYLEILNAGSLTYCKISKHYLNDNNLKLKSKNNVLNKKSLENVKIIKELKNELNLKNKENKICNDSNIKMKLIIKKIKINITNDDKIVNKLKNDINSLNHKNKKIKILNIIIIIFSLIFNLVHLYK